MKTCVIKISSFASRREENDITYHASCNQPILFGNRTLLEAMVEKKNISWVVNERLCLSCGACESVCPTRSISFEETAGGLYFPRISSTGCADCGLCATVCPGSHFAAGIMRSLPEDPFVGTALGCWVGKASDLHTFRNGQSGGIVSALLITALELGLIDTAVVVVMQPGNPPRPTVRLASTREEILQAQKSKYCPTPVLSALRHLEKKGQRAALVGLPCHMHGFLNIADKFHSVHNVVRHKIGLVCERVFSYAGLAYLIERSGLPVSDGLVVHFKDKTITGTLAMSPLVHKRVIWQLCLLKFVSP